MSNVVVILFAIMAPFFSVIIGKLLKRLIELRSKSMPQKLVIKFPFRGSLLVESREDMTEEEAVRLAQFLKRSIEQSQKDSSAIAIEPTRITSGWISYKPSTNWIGFIAVCLLIFSFIFVFLLGNHAARTIVGGNTFPPTATPITKPPTLVQKAFISGEFPVIKVALASPVAARNLIVVAITQWDGVVRNVTDTQGDSYSPVVNEALYATLSTSPDSIDGRNHDYVQLYFAKNTKGGLTTVTVTFSATVTSQSDMNVGIYEFSGLDTNNPVESVVANRGFGSVLGVGILHSTSSNGLFFVVGVDDDGNNTPPLPGKGFYLLDQQDNSNTERFYTEDQVAVSRISQTDFVIATASHWAVIGVSFKPA